MSSDHSTPARFWHAPPRGYRLGPCIGGRPGVTRIFAATDPHGTPCALKTLDPRAAERPEPVVRFAREVATHVAAAAAAGVVPARIADAEGAWLAMSWAYGGDMAALAERGGESASQVAARATEFVATLLRTIAELHAHGIAHRDIKPSNLLLDGNVLWLTDFGIAARREHAEAGAEAGVKERVAAVWRAVPAPLRELQAGTPPWAAPELSLSPPGVTTASDVYSLGVLWRWMRTLGDGSAPLTAAHTALLDAMLADAPDARPTAHDALALLIAN